MHAARVWVSAIVFGATLAGSGAFADDVEALVAEGVALRKDHKDLDALRLFRLAYAQSPSSRTRAQIGLAEQALGKWIEAEDDLSAALKDVSDPWIEKNGPVLRAALVSIREHLGWLELSGRAGVGVTVNGQPRGTLPLAQPVRVVAGTVMVELTRQGFEAKRVALDVPPTGTVKHTVPDLDRLPEKDVPLVRAAPARVRVPLLEVVLASVGGAGVVVGAWYGFQTFRLRSERDEHCAATCDPYGLSLDRDARRAGWTSTVAFAVGVPALAVATILLVRAPSAEVRLTAQPSALTLTGTF